MLELKVPNLKGMMREDDVGAHLVIFAAQDRKVALIREKSKFEPNTFKQANFPGGKMNKYMVGGKIAWEPWKQGLARELHEEYPEKAHDLVRMLDHACYGVVSSTSGSFVSKLFVVAFPSYHEWLKAKYPKLEFHKIDDLTRPLYLEGQNIAHYTSRHASDILDAMVEDGSHKMGFFFTETALDDDEDIKLPPYIHRAAAADVARLMSSEVAPAYLK